MTPRTPPIGATTLPRELVGTGGIVWCLDRARTRIGRTLANLDELADAGFGATTQMSGSPGGGRSSGRTIVIDTERIPVSGVEAAVLAGHGPDECARATSELRTAAAAAVGHANDAVAHVVGMRPADPAPGTYNAVAHAWRCALLLQAGALDGRWELAGGRWLWGGWLTDVRHIERICDRWGFVPGKPVQAATRAHSAQSGDDGLAVDLTELWCRSCLTHGHRTPRSERYATVGLCRHCGDFTATEGFHPTGDIVDAWSSGRRLTTVVVEAARLEHRRARKRRR